VVPCFDVVVASPTKHLEVKGFGNGTVRRYFLIRKFLGFLRVSFKIGVAQKRKKSMFQRSLFWSAKKTFEFLEVQVDKNLAVGEKLWQIGG